MAALTRLSSIKSLRNVVPRSPSLRCISTSKKNSDTATATETTAESGVEVACKTEAKKNWISYGFSIEDEKEDLDNMHATFFLGVTLCFVFGGFVLAYRPDHLGIDWAHREAFLELRRREKAGLPLVDMNYIPADKINLPSDEELGDTEIII